MTAKILLMDLETAPSIVYTWGRWDQNIGGSQVITESYLLTWAARWLDNDKEVFSDMLPNHKKAYKKDPTNDKEIVKSLSDLMNQADIVVAHNGDGFDMKWLRKQLAKHQLPNISTQRTIDTLKVAKRYFNFPSNRLDELAVYLNVDERKLKTDFSLWADCVAGKKDAWRAMMDYNIQDLEPLAAIYLRLRPFMTNHPNLAVYSDSDESACPVCNSTELVKNGYYFTNLSQFQRYKCNGCGNRKIRGRTNLLSKTNRKALLTNAT